MLSIEKYPELVSQIKNAVDFTESKLQTLNTKSAIIEQTESLLTTQNKIDQLKNVFLAEQRKFETVYNQANTLRLMSGIPKEFDTVNDPKIEEIINKYSDEQFQFDSKSIVALFLSVEMILRNLLKLSSLQQFFEFSYGKKAEDLEDIKKVQLFVAFKNYWVAVTSYEAELNKQI